MRRAPTPAPVGGFVLVAVLLVLLAVGVVAVAMSLEAGLSTLAARSASGAAVARSAARAALVLGLDEAQSIGSSGALPAELGPWEEEGVEATVVLTRDPGTDPPVYRLAAVAAAGRSRAEAGAVLVLEPEPRVLEWKVP